MLKDVRSGCFKKPMHDTRNNWVTMEFNTKYRYNCFRKQSHNDTCIDGFRELEQIGFEFGPFGFAGNHVHFPVNIPKRYSVQDAQIMLKSRNARRMFEHHPGFRKRCPRGWFWSGYENYESTGWIDLDRFSAYCSSQQQHYGVTVIDDRQQRLPN